MDSANKIKAILILLQFVLTLIVSGFGPLNPFIGTYTQNGRTQALVSATPDSSEQLSSWSNDPTGSMNPPKNPSNENKTQTATFSEDQYATYTITLEGANSVARDSDGTIVATSSDFGSMWRALNSKLIPGDSVLIKSGSYTVSTSPTLTGNHLTVMGETGAKLEHESGFTGVLLIIGGSHNVVSNLIFDDDTVGGQAAAVVVRGSYNTLKGCTLTNCDRYGFSTWGADHFSILDNTVLKAQYGIAGLDNEASSIWSSDGLVQGNKVYDCRDAGIKMKMWKNVLVTENTVDVGYKTWGKAGSNGQFGITVPSDGCVGIWYYHLDTPTQNVTVSYNTITDSVKVENKGIGIIIDPDGHLDWPSCPYPANEEKILNNVITVRFYSMIIQGNGSEINDNEFSQGRVRIDGDNNILTRNLGRVQNNGFSNMIS